MREDAISVAKSWPPVLFLLLLVAWNVAKSIPKGLRLTWLDLGAHRPDPTYLPANARPPTRPIDSTLSHPFFTRPILIHLIQVAGACLTKSAPRIKQRAGSFITQPGNPEKYLFWGARAWTGCVVGKRERPHSRRLSTRVQPDPAWPKPPAPLHHPLFVVVC